MGVGFCHLTVTSRWTWQSRLAALMLYPAAKAVSIDGIPYAPGEAFEFIRKLRPSQLAFINISDIPANPIIYGPLASGGLIEIKLRP